MRRAPRPEAVAVFGECRVPLCLLAAELRLRLNRRHPLHLRRRDSGPCDPRRCVAPFSKMARHDGALWRRAICYKWTANAASKRRLHPVADNRDRLSFKFFRVVEGQAVGRFAIIVFALLVFAVLIGVIAESSLNPTLRI